MQRCGISAYQPQHMRGPHGGGKAFAGNVTGGEKSSIACVEDADKVSGEKLRRKDLAGDFISSTPDAAWTAQPARYLQRIEYFAVERAGLFGLERGSRLGRRRRGHFHMRIRSVDAHPVHP